MTIDQLQALLKKYHLEPDKKYGQNFLLNESVLEDMLRAAQVGLADTILEIGPGVGNLTERLLESGCRVVAVEKDTKFTKLLRNIEARYPGQLEVVFGDILRFDLAQKFKHRGYKVVANIPYYVTGKLLQVMLRAPVLPRGITVLVQKEVAENVVAKPGAMNLLALSVQLVGTPHLVRVVQAKDFFPPPKVDSAVLHIDLPRASMHPVISEPLLFRVAKACFVGKRKQIHNTLSANLHLTASVVGEVLEAVGIAATARPQELSVQQFILLANSIGARLPHL